MNINDYRRGMDQIVPDAALKERIMNQTKKKTISARRVFAGVLAAALSIACLITAAFAASPELRTAVLSFFRLEEREHLPNSNISPGAPDISQTEIGELVKAQYIKMDSYQYGYSGGLLHHLTWSEDYRTLLDYKFWEVKDNELIPVQVDMHTNQIDVTRNGIRYRGELYWFVRNGELFFFKGTPYGVDTHPEDEWYVQAIPGRTDAVLLKLAQGRQMDYTEYPILYHLDTGEAEDILAGTGVEQLEYAYDYSWSENMRRAIILSGGQPDELRTWLCDLDAGSLTEVDALVDIDVYTAAFADNDTLILYSAGRDEEGVLRDVTFYAYDIPSGRMTKTLDRTPYYQRMDENPSGAMPFGSRCVLISEEGQVQVVDLKTGDRTLLGGFTFRKGDSFQLNPSGNRLLYFSMNSNADSLGISQIGVADLEKGTFFAFDREGYDNLHEGGIGWDDDNTVSIRASTLDNETQYLLVYQF